MKKLLISILTVLLLVLVTVTLVQGISIGKLNILGIKELSEKNKELDKTIEQATKLVTTDYEKSLDELDTKTKELEDKKKEYEDKVALTSETQLQTNSTSTSVYKISYLWVRLGTHARKQKVEMEVNASNLSLHNNDMQADVSQENKKYDCNLNFTVTGSYIRIAQFIRNIEDDNNLGFKIENFKMTPQENDTLQATFVCNSIVITGITNTDGGQSTMSTNSNSSSNTTSTNTNTNTTNTTAK